MCCWCWGFEKTWSKIKKALPDDINIQYVLGGLAPDSNEIMPIKMHEYIQKNWRKIQTTIPNTKFNYDFWKKCQPKRSTYPACRAVIATKNQHSELERKVIKLIQHAYYLHAQNPSEDSTLIQLANSLNLDIEKFTHDLNSKDTQQKLKDDISLAHSLGVSSFPSLVLVTNGVNKHINIDYNNENFVLKQILA